MHYREALFEGFRRIQERGILTISDIVAIQEILVRNGAGIRSQPGTALVNDKTNQVIYTPPLGVEQINRLLGNLVEYLHSRDDSLSKLAVLHYQFESIHPFYDGNGRAGRIVNVLYLVMKGYLDIPILYLSSYIISNRSRYYSLLLGVTREKNWADWILFVLKGIELTARETIEKVNQIKLEIDRSIDVVRRKAPKIYSKELIETLFVNPYCKVEFVVSSIGVERKAASRYLHQLTEIGVLEVQKLGKENLFVNKRLMEILKKSNIDFGLT
jgi:Fic family protein